ncbi:MAG: GNAT family N-acetyltransferase [Acidimicrobiales bacterium]|nr:GNAT family N-acetyltransferase [Acidimicrobiales bacterium]
MDGTPAAMLHAHDGFLADEGCGYVRHVGVRRERRGQGLARLLLRTAFAADAARGRAGTLLHVDANNTTPALGLYRSLGMRPVLVVDVWRRPGR